MAYEQFANNATTTLTGSVNNSSDPVVITVAVATKFPATGNFRILIDNEILLVTSVSGTSFTCNRAQEGTTIASHSNGQTVTSILTRGSFLQALADYNLSGTFASRPAAGVAGRKYFCTDTPFWYYDNGGTWDKFFGSYPIVTPSSSGFSWDNQNGSVLTTTKDMLTMFAQNNASFRYKTAPSVPYTVDVAFLFNTIGTHLFDFHFGFRNSVSGKIHSLSIRSDPAGLLTLNSWKWTTASSFDTPYLSKNLAIFGQTLFLRIQDDNTDRVCYFSTDGINFAEFHRIGRTDFFTANQVCWGTGCDTNTTTMSASLIHWQEN